MKTWYDCSLDGTPLSSVSESIVITDISETPSEYSTVLPRPVSHGSRFVRRQRESLSVAVSFAIREQSVERRMEIMQMVQKWAQKGGYFARSDRPGQRLMVVCDTPPTMDSALNWTDVLQMTFVAYVEPYWESQNAAKLSTTGRKQLFVPGTAKDCRATASITVTGSELTSVTLQTDISKIQLTGLSIPQNGVINIGYNDAGYLFIRHGEKSMLLDRTIGSSDELRVPVGYSDVSVSANTDVSVTLTARGAWL